MLDFALRTLTHYIILEIGIYALAKRLFFFTSKTFLMKNQKK
jgi:hypothetical protein